MQNSSTAFGAKLSSAQSVGSGSNTVLQFASEDFDNGSDLMYQIIDLLLQRQANIYFMQDVISNGVMQQEK